jgi:hypothetical protein
MDNALVLVVGYNSSTGDYDFNQIERKACEPRRELFAAGGWALSC